MNLEKIKNFVSNLSEKDKNNFYSLVDSVANIIELSPDKSYLKLLSTNLLEYKDSISVFKPYASNFKVCLFGSARVKPSDKLYKMTEMLAKNLAKEGFFVVTGAGPGLMEAGNKGAGSKSFGLNIILPFEQTANDYILNTDRLVSFKYFFLRKLIFIKESQASILLPGGFGTYDEAYELLTLMQTGRCSPRPIILLDEKNNNYWKNWIEILKKNLLSQSYISQDDLSLFKHYQRNDEAINYIKHFYSNYMSIEHLNDETVLFIHRALSQKRLTQINKEFAYILTSGFFIQKKAEDSPNYDLSLSGKTALHFKFDKKQFSSLIKLIHKINKIDD